MADVDKESQYGYVFGVSGPGELNKHSLQACCHCERSLNVARLLVFYGKQVVVIVDNARSTD